MKKGDIFKTNKEIVTGAFSKIPVGAIIEIYDINKREYGGDGIIARVLNSPKVYYENALFNIREAELQ
jgi:hypothetical protein